MSGDNRTLGRFHLDGLPPAPRGVPQIEVTFDLDANGILNVKAQDKGTGREQSVRIEASSTLSRDDVERLVHEAESNAAEDRKRREEVELRNEADQMLYQAEKTINENGDKIPEDVKSEVEGKMQAVRDASQGDAATLRQAMDDFNTSLAKVGQHIYQEAGGASGSRQPGGGQSGGGQSGGGQSGGGQSGGEAPSQDEGDVVDADYREVQ
jgi:molecular chaperone DnaK